MIDLDTGCLVKLYYPQPDSGALASRLVDWPIYFAAVHEFELGNALGLKRFRGEASEAQVIAAMNLIREDLGSGVLVAPDSSHRIPFSHAAQLALAHSPTIGCRSLDILHCAFADDLDAAEFVATDERQTGSRWRWDFRGFLFEASGLGRVASGQGRRPDFAAV